jgi:3'-phosphoadenosine 5'-phosphosulfate sulfotransferase (PAPS reductase)/FAD synthetase
VCSAAIRNQDRFKGKRTVVLTGERAEESAARAKYKIFEAHRASSTERRVDHIRPILHYTSAQVWKLIERHRIHPHPAYYLGWGRVSCAACIFGSKNQWASLNALAPAMVERIAQYEDEFGHTINRKKTVRELVAEGVPYQSITDRWAKLAMSKDFTPEVIMEPWEPPAGMHGENTGPI